MQGVNELRGQCVDNRVTRNGRPLGAVFADNFCRMKRADMPVLIPKQACLIVS